MLTRLFRRRSVSRFDREAAADEVEGVVGLDAFVDELLGIDALGRRGRVAVEQAHLGFERFESACAAFDALRRLCRRPERTFAADEDVEQDAERPDVDLSTAVPFAA